MTGNQLRAARLARRWTQAQSAVRFGVTQAYVSMMERGLRPVPRRFARKLVRSGQLPATALPIAHAPRLTSNELTEQLGALGYPGFAYLREKPRYNPAALLLAAVMQEDMDARAAEALPWLVWKYAEMDWNWLEKNAKLHDLQNRLGFVVSLASRVAEKMCDPEARRRLSAIQERLDHSRLAREDTFCRGSMTLAERNWLRQSRSADAAHWNLLTGLTAEQLKHAIS